MSTSDSQLDAAPLASTLPSALRPAPPKLPKRRPQPRDEPLTPSGENVPAIGRGPTAPPPPPPVPPPDTAELPAPAREDEKRRVGWLFSLPGWLISTIVHLVAFLLMALVTFSIAKPKHDRLLIVVDADQRFEPLSITSAVEMAQLENALAEAPGIYADELTSADFGESLSRLPRSDSSAALAEVDATLQDFGVLFGSQGSGLTQLANSGKGAEFFGVKAGGQKFVFIVDSSNSMKKGKFDAALRELEYAIRRLDKNQYFYIIFFDHDAARMTFAPNKEPEERAVPANGKNIKLADEWMAGVKNELRTDPYDAVKFAVELLPDAIYILTDGKFTDKGKTERYLERHNKLDDPIDGRRPKVVIHTVGFWSPAGEDTLKRIAKEYGGTYRYVAAPPGFKGK